MRRVPIAGILAATIVVTGAAGTERVSGAAASAQPPATVALVGKGTRAAFRPVDPGTLEPLPGFGSVRLPPHAYFDLSEDSTRIAIATPQQTVIADTASGRILGREGNEGYDVSYGLYWVGRHRNALPQTIAVGESKFGYEYTAMTIRGTHGFSVDTDLWPAAALRGALVLLGEGWPGEGAVKGAVQYFGRGGHPTVFLEDLPH